MDVQGGGAAPHRLPRSFAPQLVRVTSRGDRRRAGPPATLRPPDLRPATRYLVQLAMFHRVESQAVTLTFLISLDTACGPSRSTCGMMTTSLIRMSFIWMNIWVRFVSSSSALAALTRSSY